MNTMTDRLKNLKRHLKSQIKEADKINSEWVYILKVEAETCLQLAEAEETIVEILAEKNRSRETK